MGVKFEFALWTRAMVRQLIRERFGVRLSEVSVGRLLKKLGLSPQRPLRRAYQQNKDLVDRWLKATFPKIKQSARKEGATIYFGDEASVRSDYPSGTTWAVRGKTPVVETTGARFSLNLISAVSSKGLMRFMAFKGKLNSDKFIVFLKRLIHNADKPVYLIVDGHPVHRFGKVRNFVLSTEGRLKLYYLPPYSPELYSDEMVWNHLKHHKMGKSAIKGPDHMKRKVIPFLRSLQRTPSKIIGFSKDPHLQYAAQ